MLHQHKITSPLCRMVHGEDQTFSFGITGSVDGSVYGTDIYTDDSDISTAAVHAGVLRVGETKTIIVKILRDQESYVGSIQNVISSLSYVSWQGSYSFINTVE